MRRLILMILIVFLAVLGGEAQFGRNRIREGNIQWKVFETRHFRIHYYGDIVKLIPQIARTLEETHDDYRKRMDIALSRKIPVVIYSNVSDFLQTNITDSSLSEGVGGFTELSKRRLVVPFKGDIFDFLRVVKHELVHVFQYEYIIPSSMPLSPFYNYLTFPPLWMMEGMAEHFSNDWQEEGRMLVRENVLTASVPDVGMMNDSVFQYYGYYGYKLAQSFTEFLCAKYGEDKFVLLFKRLSGRISTGLSKEFRRVYGVEMNVAYEIWREQLKQTYWNDGLDTKNPYEVFSFTELKSGMREQYDDVFMYAPVISPLGDVCAVYSGLRGETDILLIGAENGRIVDNITKGLSDRKFDYIKIIPSGICWDGSGDKVSFIVRKGNRDAVATKDIITGRLKMTIPRGLDSLTAVETGGDGWLYVTGQTGSENAAAKLYDDGRTEILAVSRFNKEDITAAGDGRICVLEKREFGDTIVLYDTVKGLKRQLYVTDNIRSMDYVDGKLYFDRNFGDGIYICSYDIDTGEARQVTESLNSTINPNASSDMLMFNIYRGGRYLTARLYKEDFMDTLLVDESIPSRYEIYEVSEGAVQAVKDASAPYKVKMKADLVGGSLQYDTGGYFRSYTTVTGMDIMGDYRFLILADLTSVQDFEDINMQLSFEYRKKRYMLNAAVYSFNEYFESDVSMFLDYYERYTGGMISASYPLSEKDRVECAVNIYSRRTSYFNLYYDYSDMAYTTLLSLVRDSSRSWGYFHPLSGHRFRLTYEQSYPVSDSLKFGSLVADLRKYWKISSRMSLAFRCVGGESWGEDKNSFKIGGVDTVRGYDYEEIEGNRILFFNGELRFPVVDIVMFSIKGFSLPYIRGIFFGDLAFAGSSEDKLIFFNNGYAGENTYGAAGFGLRLYLGSLLNLKTDWAYRLDGDRLEGRPVFHFGISQDF